MTTDPDILPPQDPETEAMIADGCVMLELYGSGQLDKYGGQHVAILNGQVVGSGKNPAQLREEVAARYQVYPERIIVVYVEG